MTPVAFSKNSYTKPYNYSNWPLPCGFVFYCRCHIHAFNMTQAFCHWRPCNQFCTVTWALEQRALIPFVSWVNSISLPLYCAPCQCNITPRVRDFYKGTLVKAGKLQFMCLWMVKSQGMGGSNAPGVNNYVLEMGGKAEGNLNTRWLFWIAMEELLMQEEQMCCSGVYIWWNN